MENKETTMNATQAKTTTTTTTTTYPSTRTIPSILWTRAIRVYNKKYISGGTVN
jgi:hypothetical protein